MSVSFQKLFLIPSLWVLWAFGCSSSSETDDTGGGGNAQGDGDGDGDGDSSGGTAGEDDINLGAASGMGGSGGGTVVDPDPGEGCATSSAQSKLTPVYLLFLLDQSGSMGDVPASYEQRWVPATDAIRSFVSDEASAGIYASLTFFPNDANKTSGPADSTYAISCDVDQYASPAVEAQLLPNLAPFDEAISEVDPPNEHGTPTKVAYLGAAKYAESLLDQGNKVAIVLITDGEPTGCPSDDDLDPFNTTLDAARALAPRAPSYVIGIGVTRFRLDQLAEAGGTEMAHIIDLTNPDMTRQELLSQVMTIQDTQISCDLPLPSPPQGEQLDTGKVNVRLRADDEESTVLYNETCEGGAGWRYDDPKDPGSIALCEKSCQSVRDSNDSSVDVVFGCETKVVIR